MNTLISFLFGLVFLLVPSSAQAVCPVCTVAVGAGLGISRLIGIDDTVSGVWVGGLILSSGLWMADFITKRKWKIPYPTLFSILVMLLFVIPPLYWSHMVGVAGNTLWGYDKILVGAGFGSIVFLLGVGIDKWLRITNDGKVYIYYQKVIAPVFLLSILSLIFHFITS